MSNRPLVYVVVLNWNLKEDTAECIDSLLQLDYPNAQIVVVDNGSTDGSVEYLASRFPQIHIVANPQNLGFTGGNNMGIKHALEHGADYVLILNNDTVVHRHALSELIKVSQADPRIGILGPLILYHEARDRIWEFGAREYKWSPIPLTIGRGQRDKGQFRSSVPLDYVTGCAMLVTSDAFRRVGLFQSRGSVYYWYGGDIEFCRRAREGGYRVMGVPTAKIWHKVALTAKKASASARYLRTRDRVIFYQQCPHGPHPVLTSVFLLVDGVKRISLDLIHGQKDLIRPLLRGLYDGYRGDCRHVRYSA